MSLLETTDLTVTFGGLHANDDVDITVEPQQFVGLIGPNGAGKTTFIDAITGYVHVDRRHRASTARTSAAEAARARPATGSCGRSSRSSCSRT